MSKKTPGKHLPGVTAIPSLSEVSKSPFVIKKVEKARVLIAKYGLPKDKQENVKKGK